MTGLRAETRVPQTYQQPTAVELAQAEVRRLAERQTDLPNLMREAAQRGTYQLVAELRIEWDQLPARLWAARYTAAHAELAAWDVTTQGQRDRHDVKMRAAELARELHK
jgi:hypothetical protein